MIGNHKHDFLPLMKCHLQIENKTLSPEEVQIGTVLSIEDHKNSISKQKEGEDNPAREGRSLTRSRAGNKARERGEPVHDRMESALVSQSGIENTLSLVKQRYVNCNENTLEPRCGNCEMKCNNIHCAD